MEFTVSTGEGLAMTIGNYDLLSPAIEHVKTPSELCDQAQGDRISPSLL